MTQNSRFSISSLSTAVLLSSLVVALGVAPQASAIPDGDSPTLDIDCNAASSVAGTITNVEVGDILVVQVTNGNPATCTIALPVGMFWVTQVGGTLSDGVLGAQWRIAIADSPFGGLHRHLPELNNTELPGRCLLTRWLRDSWESLAGRV